MQSHAKTVKDYLGSLPPERRAAIDAVRCVILENLRKGYEEGMQWGMIGYFVPHSVYPAGYHADPKQPLPFISLGSQKNHLGLYLFCTYGDEEAFRRAWAATGKKLDMGKACLRFRNADELALDVIGRTIKALPVKTYIARYEDRLGDRAKPATKRAAAKPATKRAAAKPATNKPVARPSKRNAIAKPAATTAIAKKRRAT